MKKQYNIEEVTILWEAFLKGDERSFSRLYCMFFEELILYGSRFCSDKVVVEDLVQDVFVSIICRKYSLESIFALRPFLYKILKNKIYNYLKRESRLSSLTDEEDIEFKLLVQFEEDAQEDTVKIVDEVLSSLTARQKEMIYLRFVNELSYEEIAEILNMNVQSAYNLVSRSMEKLRKIHQLGVLIY